MLTIDANVWIAAADRNDFFAIQSRNFLAEIARQRLNIFLPAFARVEVACSLARRKQNAVVGERLANSILAAADVEYVPMGAQFLAHALQSGTRYFLRAGDALYVATAEINQTALISWDVQLVQRTPAITPNDWLAANQ